VYQHESCDGAVAGTPIGIRETAISISGKALARRFLRTCEAYQRSLIMDKKRRNSVENATIVKVCVEMAVPRITASARRALRSKPKPKVFLSAIVPTAEAQSDTPALRRKQR
jgi:hypothetical protein